MSAPTRLLEPLEAFAVGPPPRLGEPLGQEVEGAVLDLEGDRAVAASLGDAGQG